MFKPSEKMFFLCTMQNEATSKVVDFLQKYFETTGIIMNSIEELIMASTKSEKIIIVGSDWLKISEELKSLGYAPFKDYIPDWIISSTDKYGRIIYETIIKKSLEQKTALEEYVNFMSINQKIAIFHGNCQISTISKILSTSSDFKEEYTLIFVPPVHVIRWSSVNENAFSLLLPHANLFIYQNVKEGPGYSKWMSTEYIKTQLQKKCITIAIPNTYFGGYFPQYTRNENRPMFGSKYNRVGIVPYGDLKINTLVEEGRSEDEIEKLLQSDNLFKKDEVEKNCKDSLAELKHREELCDVKISDFIEDNYKKKYLFYTINHPTKEVLREVTKRIADKLGYKDDLETKEVAADSNIQQFIYPSVKKHLKLTFPEKRFALCLLFNPNTMDVGEYVRAYKYFYYPNRWKWDDEWMSDVPRSIDVSAEVKLNAGYIRERSPKVMTINEGTVHLALYLNKLKEIPNLEVAEVPEHYAPEKNYVIPLHVIGKGVFPATIDTNGKIRFNLKTGTSEDIIVVDTTWNIKYREKEKRL